jgi:hypothetical protein
MDNNKADNIGNGFVRLLPGSSAKNPDLYAGKIALAPMVRAGRTPLRVLSLGNGADLVYSEEIVDQKLLECSRAINGFSFCFTNKSNLF